MPSVDSSSATPPDPYTGPVPQGMRHVGWYCPGCHAMRPTRDVHAAFGCLERVNVEGPHTEGEDLLGLNTAGGTWYWSEGVDQRPVFVQITEDERYEQLEETP